MLCPVQSLSFVFCGSSVIVITLLGKRELIALLSLVCGMLTASHVCLLFHLHSLVGYDSVIRAILGNLLYYFCDIGFIQ